MKKFFTDNAGLIMLGEAVAIIILLIGIFALREHLNVCNNKLNSINNLIQQEFSNEMQELGRFFKNFPQALHDKQSELIQQIQQQQEEYLRKIQP